MELKVELFKMKRFDIIKLLRLVIVKIYRIVVLLQDAGLFCKLLRI